jgi:hypothetical protein
MIKHAFLSIVVLSVLTFGHSPRQPQLLAITHVAVVDVASQDPRRSLDRTVIVSGERISLGGHA